MKKCQGHALTVRKFVDSQFEQLLAITLLFGHRNSFYRLLLFGKKTPTRAISIEMIDRQIRSHGLKPSANTAAVSNFRKSFVCSDEHLLGDVFSVSEISENPGRKGKNHILVVP